MRAFLPHGKTVMRRWPPGDGAGPRMRERGHPRRELGGAQPGLDRPGHSSVQLTIAPPWTATDDLKAQSDQLIVIQPSMGFGTGHHASTRLCLRWLQALALDGRVRLLMWAPGSGVLAIAAAALGAGRAVGIDVDPGRARVRARKRRSESDRRRIELRELDLSDAAAAYGASFDVILGNLTGGLLCRDARPSRISPARARA
jgi:ribosomal protein L11 methylase PrmA